MSVAAAVDRDVSRLGAVLGPPVRVTDPVTGLPTHALLMDRLNQALVRSRTHGTLTSLILMTIQEPEATVDLLTAIGVRLRSGLREDLTVARFGTSEFAVVEEHLHGTGRDIAVRIRDLAHRADPGVRVRVAWATSDGEIETGDLLAHAVQRLRG